MSGGDHYVFILSKIKLKFQILKMTTISTLMKVMGLPLLRKSCLSEFIDLFSCRNPTSIHQLLLCAIHNWSFPSPHIIRGFHLLLPIALFG